MSERLVGRLVLGARLGSGLSSARREGRDASAIEGIDRLCHRHVGVGKTMSQPSARYINVSIQGAPSKQVMSSNFLPRWDWAVAESRE